MRGHWFALQANQWFFTKRKQKKIELVSRPGDDPAPEVSRLLPGLDPRDPATVAAVCRVATDGLADLDNCLLGVSGGVTPFPLALLSPMTLTSSLTDTPCSSGGMSLLTCCMVAAAAEARSPPRRWGLWKQKANYQEYHQRLLHLYLDDDVRKSRNFDFHFQSDLQTLINQKWHKIPISFVLILKM